MTLLILQLPARVRLIAQDACAPPPAALGSGECDWVQSSDGRSLHADGRCAAALLPRAATVVAVLAETDVACHRIPCPKAPAARLNDLFNATRSVDLAVVSDQGEGWITDLGAYERQGLLPLVGNAKFSANRIVLWSAGSAGIWVSDSAQNDGTGAVYVRQTAPPGGRALGPTQCVRLSGPGNYSLSGWGKEPSSGMTDADYPRLEWRLFPNSPSCQGSPSVEGGIALPSGNGWAELAVPTSFELPAAQFAGNAA